MLLYPGYNTEIVRPTWRKKIGKKFFTCPHRFESRDPVADPKLSHREGGGSCRFFKKVYSMGQANPFFLPLFPKNSPYFYKIDCSPCAPPPRP